MSNKIPFGLKDQIMVDVEHVASGIACGCICPSCFAPLQARKGEIYCYHFAHLPSAEVRECSYAPESSLHRMAKQILCEEKCIILPELIVSESSYDLANIRHKKEEIVAKKANISFDTVEAEKSYIDIKPDIVASRNGKDIFIEIYVTHKVDYEKKQKIKKYGVPVIEIDLTNYLHRNDFSKDLLKNLLVHNVKIKKWVFHPNESAVRTALKRELKILTSKENTKIKAGTHKKNSTRNESISPKVKSNTRWLRCYQCKHVFSTPKVKEADAKVPCMKCNTLITPHKPSFNSLKNIL